MPRKPRREFAGAIHHVFARGNAKQRVYLDDRDRARYLGFLGATVARHRWRCLSFCLLDNHLHLLIETPKPNLGAGMRWLQGRYAQTFNHRHGRSGHLFQGRFGAVVMETDAQLLVTARYIARNPVEAGLCADPADWRWSSHGATIGDARPAWLDAARLLSHFGALGGDARRRYAEFVSHA